MEAKPQWEMLKSFCSPWGEQGFCADNMTPQTPAQRLCGINQKETQNPWLHQNIIDVPSIPFMILRPHLWAAHGLQNGPLLSAWLSKLLSGPQHRGGECSVHQSHPQLVCHPKCPLCFWSGTFRGILQKTFWIRQWHSGYDSSYLTLAAHKVQGWDTSGHVATRHPVPYGLPCVTPDLHPGLAVWHWTHRTPARSAVATSRALVTFAEALNDIQNIHI